MDQILPSNKFLNYGVSLIKEYSEQTYKKHKEACEKKGLKPKTFQLLISFDVRAKFYEYCQKELMQYSYDKIEDYESVGELIDSLWLQILESLGLFYPPLPLKTLNLEEAVNLKKQIEKQNYYSLDAYRFVSLNEQESNLIYLYFINVLKQNINNHDYSKQEQLLIYYKYYKALFKHYYNRLFNKYKSYSPLYYSDNSIFKRKAVYITMQQFGYNVRSQDDINRFFAFKTPNTSIGILMKKLKIC